MTSSTVHRVALLASLYFAQGLPYGFFTQALPVWMRQHGYSLSLIGASSVLALPWALKLLWAPLVDRFGGSPLGRRRGWILPLQALSALAVCALALVGGALPNDHGGDAATALLLAMAIAMFVTNLFAATQDIATDGLAVDILRPEERGLGNGVQVAAYRVGMVTGGGALLAGFSTLGWTSTLFAMAALLALSSLPIALYREPKVEHPEESASDASRVSLLASLRFFTRGGGRYAIWACGLVAFKIGDAIGSPMARTLMVDRGFSTTDVAFILGTLGSVAGMIGALLGGVVAKRNRLAALLVCGLVHAALMAAYAVPTFIISGQVDENARLIVAWLVVLEHVTGGMATVSLFTAMMDAAMKKTGASDYTAQASVVVLASGVGSSLSGVSADALGYGPHFIMAGAVCALGALVMVPLYRLGIAPAARADDAVNEQEDQ